jgi:hypothetical protein
MRQGGLKPKNHNSGIYWTRAHSGSKQASDSNEIGIFSQIIFWGLLYPVVVAVTWIREKFESK